MEETENTMDIIDLLILIISIYIPLIITKYSERNKENKEILLKTSTTLMLVMKDIEFNLDKMSCTVAIIEELINSPINYNGRNLKLLNRKRYYWTEIILDNLKCIKEIDTSNLAYSVKFEIKENIIFDIKEYNNLIIVFNQEVDKLYNHQAILKKSQMIKLLHIFKQISDKHKLIKGSIEKLEKNIQQSYDDLMKVNRTPFKLLRLAVIIMVVIIIVSVIVQMVYKVNIFDFEITKLLYYVIPIICLVITKTIEKIIIH